MPKTRWLTAEDIIANQIRDWMKRHGYDGGRGFDISAMLDHLHWQARDRALKDAIPGYRAL